MKALYIHIPFCNFICNYCDFVKRVSNPQTKEDYMNALYKELEQYKQYFNTLETIYIGGGTPTSLDPVMLEQLLSYINTNIDVTKLKEFSIESNVETLSIEKIKLLKKYNVSRISLGVQTFDNELLKVIGRKHTQEDVRSVIKNLNNEGITNINIDMMFAIPTQTMEKLNNDLTIIRDLDIEHVSYYSLILEEGTVFYHQFSNDALALLDNEDEANMYQHVMDILQMYGFKQYEISNFTKGQISHHNKVYWLNEEYIGCGLGAHGYINGSRYANTFDLKQYLTNDFIEDSNELSIEDKMSEELILGLRLIEGVSIDKFTKKYNKDIFEVFPVIKDQMNKGHLEVVEGYLKLTDEAILIGNEIFELFLGE